MAEVDPTIVERGRTEVAVGHSSIHSPAFVGLAGRLRSTQDGLGHLVATPRQQVARLPHRRGRRPLRLPVVLDRVGQLAVAIERINGLREQLRVLDDLGQGGPRRNLGDEVASVATEPAVAELVVEAGLTRLVVGVLLGLFLVDGGGKCREDVVEEVPLLEYLDDLCERLDERGRVLEQRGNRLGASEKSVSLSN